MSVTTVAETIDSLDAPLSPKAWAFELTSAFEPLGKLMVTAHHEESIARACDCSRPIRLR
jgi:hypothetical protein